jgi:hypothetical protein
MSMTSVQRAPLTDEMLARFDERAPIYDRENRFFDEDFEELVASGYTKLAVPSRALPADALEESLADALDDLADDLADAGIVEAAANLRSAVGR